MTNKHRVHYNSALSRDKQLVCKRMACWMHCRLSKRRYSFQNHKNPVKLALWFPRACILHLEMMTPNKIHSYIYVSKHIIPKLNESEEEDVKKWSRDRTKCAETNFRLSSPTSSTSSTSPTCKTAPPCALIVGSVSYVSSARMPKHAKDRLPIRAQL